MFDFSASPNDVAPLSSILLTVGLMMRNSELFMNLFRVLFLFVFTLQIELSECCI